MGQDSVENTDIYSIDIVSKSPNVRTYLMELVLEMLETKVDDGKIGKLYNLDKDKNNLDK